MESIYKIVDSVNGFLWGKNILVFMLIGAAIYFSVLKLLRPLITYAPI